MLTRRKFIGVIAIGGLLFFSFDPSTLFASPGEERAGLVRKRSSPHLLFGDPRRGCSAFQYPHLDS
ncbi:MAG: hypothetical protein AMJ41_04750 [candidate division Zixibacteria bacterium DG_27]|nr:MAG: hypothetical protein AMJ41_04750 [candidate division Zixibacteria bacterium DG_27]